MSLYPESKEKSADSDKEVNVLNNSLSEYETGVVKETEVKRGLKSRHISMIALGGTIGTGLFVGTSSPLQDAGPVNTLIAYLFMGTLAYSVTQSLGEMATHTPVSGSFCVFNSKYISKSIGFATNWLYWFSWAITFAIELSVVGEVIQYWTYSVPLWAWMLIFYVILTTANFIPVRFYGEIEFWVAAVKVVAILGFIIYALCMVCGAGKTGAVGFRYWRNPGPWGPGILVSNKNTGRFLGWLSSLINAAFTYQGVELTGISAGETANPRKAVPKAINKVIFRILVFYILTLFFIGLLVPYNDPSFSDETTFISTSPFLIAIKNSGTKVLPHIFNAVMLTTIISAGNSNIYIGSRTLYSMAHGGVAPKFFKWTTPQGVPYVGVIATSLIGLLAFLTVSNSGTTVFNWLVNITAVAGLFAWGFISVAHIRFMKVLKSRLISRDSLPYKALFMPVFAWYAAILIFIIILIQGFEAFFDFTASDFFTAYISVILFFVLWLGSQLTIYRKEPWLIPLDEVDITSDARRVDEEIWEEEKTSRFDAFWDTVL